MTILDQIAKLGQGGLVVVGNLGRAGMVVALALLGPPDFRHGPALLIRQLYSVGVFSLLIIAVSGLFVGMVLALQGYNLLIRFDAVEALGQAVSVTLVRELGPVISALLFAGRAGSALTAEIGLMKATEQLAAMEVIGVDPIRRVVRPRLWAGIIAMPLLAQIFNVVALWGAVIIGVGWLGVGADAFWTNMQDYLEFRRDIFNGVIKAAVFGGVITWIAVFQGYNTVPTSEGISRATTRTVVYSSLAVLGMDFLLTAVMFGVN